MQIINATLEDLDYIMDIYDVAKKIMTDSGNNNQWLDGYPSKNLIRTNILENLLFKCVEKKIIVGVFYFRVGLDPTYANIYQGSWLNNKPYGVVHRLASSGENKGIARSCLDWCFLCCNNIRIDTHRENLIMQKVLIKNNFAYCGIIHLDDGSERLAYQKYHPA